MIPPIHKNGQNGILLRENFLLNITNMPTTPPMINERMMDNIPWLKFKKVTMTNITKESPYPNHFNLAKI